MVQRNAAKEWVWPSLLDVESASKATWQGFYAATFVAIATAAGALAGHFGYFERYGVDLTGLADSAIFAVIAFGISKYSRVAAVSGLVFYLIEKAVLILSYDQKVGGLTLIIILAFINSIRGAFQRKKLLLQAASPTAPQ